MNICIKYSKFLFTVGILLCCHHEIFSQWTRDQKIGLFMGVNLGPSQTRIINQGSLQGVLSTEMTSYFGSVEIGYFFSKYLGISTGISYDPYKSQLTLPTWQTEFSAVDSENESYERRVSGTDIKEVQNLDYLSIPVYLILRLPFSKKIGFFLQGGLDLAFPMNKNYTSSGTFTYRGYYASYNVLLENLPEYGFPTNLNSSTEGELKIKQFNTKATIYGGFDFFLQRKVQIGVGAFYRTSLSNLSAYTTPDTYRLSSGVDQINSLMGGSSKVSLQSFGLKMCFRYYL